MSKLISTPVWPTFDQEEQDAVARVLASGATNYWYGEEGKLFEQEFAAWCGAKYGLCVSNGTIALELALKAIGIGHGDEVIVTPRSFLASAAAVVAVGAIPVFAEIDAISGNMSLEGILGSISKHTKAILVVHLGGWPAPMPEIITIAKTHNLRIVEDCAQAHGAKIEGKRVGTFGDIAAFSFCQDKIISTGGEGGMLVTNNQQAYDVAWSLRDHGRGRERTLSDNHPFGFRWLQERIGTNARMTEMQSAIGRCQLRKVDEWVEQRTNNAMRIIESLHDNERVHFPMPSSEITHAYYRLAGFVTDYSSRDSIVNRLQCAGVHASVGPCAEIYREQAFQNLELVPQNPLPIAHEYGQKSIVLSVHPRINEVLPSIIEELQLAFT
jgi:dTDP-4-amino-4,6-dideoxygalactose transaminase